MFKIQNLREWKTTLVGFLIIIAAIAYPFFGAIDPWIYAICLSVGISLMFLPDAFITALKKILESNSDKKF
jgi:hypothetical protein